MSNSIGHWNALFVTTMWTNIAASTASTTTATQRPGWRTGTARIGSGRPRPEPVTSLDIVDYCDTDGFTVGLSILPTCTPQFFRTFS
ncbi:hypothetical protein NUM_18170 [Actinocatenispora comari]|uniref:Uncharacterized protein n=1 Tax=Actinocatenispora comari TaxID=2807577 RepID=A0A8J4A965_9ACTN|nr:hypothetical protein NUM_18170 [Actinocatenispora comari]